MMDSRIELVFARDEMGISPGKSSQGTNTNAQREIERGRH